MSQKRKTINGGLMGEPNTGMRFRRQGYVLACHSNSFIIKRSRLLVGAVEGYNANLDGIGRCRFEPNRSIEGLREQREQKFQWMPRQTKMKTVSAFVTHARGREACFWPGMLESKPRWQDGEVNSVQSYVQPRAFRLISWSPFRIRWPPGSEELTWTHFMFQCSWRLVWVGNTNREAAT